MKKYVNTRVLLLFCLCALLLAGAAVTYAWYRPIKLNFAPAKVDGSIRASYFQSGDGSKDAPFEIAKPEQFYNLAWLQYLGRFNEAGENKVIPTTYFYLSADIDMTGYVLPPVGTEKYPFVGNFDGKGNTVTGLEIAVPTDLPIEGEYEKPQIVGAFGVVGTMGDTKDSITIDGKNYTYSSAANEVKNVTFKRLTVETQTANALIGLAAGYVNGTLTNVGIQLDNTLMSKLDIKFNTSPLNTNFANLSDHSLVGYTKDVETDTSNTVKHYQPTAAQGTFTAKGETGDDETSGGGALNLSNLHARLSYFYNNSAELGNSDDVAFKGYTGIAEGAVTFNDKFAQSGAYYLYGRGTDDWNQVWKYPNLNETNPEFSNTYYVFTIINYVNYYMTVHNGKLAIADNPSAAIPFTFAADGGSVYVLLNGKNYYLVKESDNSVGISENADNGWQLEDKKLKNGDYYLTLSADKTGWAMSTQGTEVRFRKATKLSTSEFYDTYIPLMVKQEQEEGTTTDFTAADNNTGYIIGGTSHSNFTAGQYGDVVVKGYRKNWIESILVTGTSEINVAKVEFPQNEDVQETARIVAANEVFQKAKNAFGETLANSNEVFALNFQGGVVDRLVKAQNASVLHKTNLINYELPESCIDFSLSATGYASFFASGLAGRNRSFFALYQIERGAADDSVVAIRQIKKIYLNANPREYIYLTDDGYIGANSRRVTDFSPESSELVFDCNALSGQRKTSTTNYWDQDPSTHNGISKLFYFQIPLNAGEYALGAVANGAALMYLDIGVDGGPGSTEGLIPAGAEVTRTKTTEVIVTEHRETSAPKGVDFVTTPVAVTPPSVTKATATKRLDGTASGVYAFSTTDGVAACTHNGVAETLGLDGMVTTAKKCIVTLTDTWQKDGAAVTRTIRVVYDGTNTTYAVTMNGETNTYTYNDLKDKADITGVGNGSANTAPRLPTPEEMAALNAEGETVLEYTYTAADAVIDSVFVPTLTAGTDGTVTVTGGSYTVTSNATLTEKKRNSSYTVTYNTNTAAP